MTSLAIKEPLWLTVGKDTRAAETIYGICIIRPAAGAEYEGQWLLEEPKGIMSIHPSEAAAKDAVKEEIRNRVLAWIEPQNSAHPRPYPDLLSGEEGIQILSDAEDLWSALQKNNLGGFSGHNRPFYILHAFKQIIEKYGKRDVGLTWPKDALDAAAPKPQPIAALQAIEPDDEETMRQQKIKDRRINIRNGYGD